MTNISKVYFHNVLIFLGEEAASTQAPEMNSTNTGNCYILTEMEMFSRKDGWLPRLGNVTKLHIGTSILQVQNTDCVSVTKVTKSGGVGFHQPVSQSLRHKLKVNSQWKA